MNNANRKLLRNNCAKYTPNVHLIYFTTVLIIEAKQYLQQNYLPARISCQVVPVREINDNYLSCTSINNELKKQIQHAFNVSSSFLTAIQKNAITLYLHHEFSVSKHLQTATAKQLSRPHRPTFLFFKMKKVRPFVMDKYVGFTKTGLNGTKKLFQYFYFFLYRIFLFLAR